MGTFYNLEAEGSILSTFIQDRDCCESVIELMKDDFFDGDNQKIFSAISELYYEKKTVDIVTVADKLRQTVGAEERRLTDKMLQMMSSNQSMIAQYKLKDYIAIIKNLSMRRKIYLIMDNGKKALNDDSNDTLIVLDNVRQELRDIVSTGNIWMSMMDVLSATYSALSDKASGRDPMMPSGIPSLDRTMSGLHKGELTIIGARPAVGKSALGANIALASALNGYKVAICSREMTAVQYGTRVISRDADIDNTKLRTGDLSPDDWTKIADVLPLYSNSNVSFVFGTRYIEDLRMEVQKKVDMGELDMLVVDYLQLMQTKQKFEKDYLRVGYVSKMLKDMTLDFNISVVALAQVGRGADGSMPSLAELRGSGDIEQDADNVIFMHRPKDTDDRYVRPDDYRLFEELKDQGKQYMLLGVAKQRQGETGCISVVFDPARMRFTAIDRTV